MLPDGKSLVRFQVVASCKRGIQARRPSVIKFIEGEGKALQKKQWWAMEVCTGLCFKDLYKLKGQIVGKIWV
jgi:hypothetical protein